MRIPTRCFALLVLAALASGCSTPPHPVDPPALHMVPVKELAKTLGLTVRGDVDGGMVVLSGDRGTIVFSPAVRGIVIGSEVRFRGHWVVIDGGRVSVPPNFVARCQPYLKPLQPKPRRVERPDPPRPEPRFRVVIDPGHGGRDPGALGHSGVREKDVNLSVARMVAADLQAKNVAVTMTRSTDVFVPLNERAAIGNRLGVDAFVSIHADWIGRRIVQGFTLFVVHTKPGYRDAERASRIAGECGLDPATCCAVLARNRPRNQLLASRLRMQMKKISYGDDRGTRLGAFRVLERSLCPAVLIELGFLSNPGEERMLARRDYQQKLAAAVAHGILQFLEAK